VSTVLPAGALVGPAIGARSANPERPPLAPLVRSTIAFTILTTAPSVAAVALFGAGLWRARPTGPRNILVTLPATALAVILLALVWLLARSSTPAVPSHRVPRLLRSTTGSVRALRDGAREAGRVLAAGHWRFLGPLVYYTFDNAVLWAAFHAYGGAPPLAVIVVGYLVGSLGAVVPVPAGVGAVDGGLVGALVLYGARAVPATAAVLLYRGVSLSLAVSLSAGAWVFGRSSAPPADPARDRARRPVDRAHPDRAVGGRFTHRASERELGGSDQ
jgi:uncharacterized membrane protein YbhN (UPF0104 family)